MCYKCKKIFVKFSGTGGHDPGKILLGYRKMLYLHVAEAQGIWRIKDIRRQRDVELPPPGKVL
jgi:hypothetical protein